MNADRLFLVKNCPECALVRAALRPAVVEDESFLGKKGQRILVFSALTDDAGRDLLDRFGLTGRYAPVLQAADGTIIDKGAKIVSYMRENGLS